MNWLWNSLYLQRSGNISIPNSNFNPTNRSPNCEIPSITLTLVYCIFLWDFNEICILRGELRYWTGNVSISNKRSQFSTSKEHLLYFLLKFFTCYVIFSGIKLKKNDGWWIFGHKKATWKYKTKMRLTSSWRLITN